METNLDINRIFEIANRSWLPNEDLVDILTNYPTCGINPSLEVTKNPPSKNPSYVPLCFLPINSVFFGKAALWFYMKQIQLKNTETMG